MDELYGIIPENLILPSDYPSLLNYESLRPIFGSNELLSTISEAASTDTNHHEIQREDDISSAIKAKIAIHPRYPRLLQAYIDCQKVGASPEITSFLEEIRREDNVYRFEADCSIGSDPELDEFMETYCDVLVKYKSDLARPFDEATLFLNKMEKQLGNLCSGISVTTTSLSDDGNVSSDEEFSGGEVEAPLKCNDRDIKDRLLQKYGGHIGSLQLEFSKKKKKGKLPKEARQTLLEWWNSHYRWPYPTEGDKLALAELTRLDPKQINNWFINQRKRHWKPSENMQYPFTDHLCA